MPRFAIYRFGRGFANLPLVTRSCTSNVILLSELSGSALAAATDHPAIGLFWVDRKGGENVGVERNASGGFSGKDTEWSGVEIVIRQLRTARDLPRVRSFHPANRSYNITIVIHHFHDSRIKTCVYKEIRFLYCYAYGD